jgi:hypothetical protein
MVPQSPNREEAGRRFSPWLRRLLRGAFDAYFTVDPRSLGLARIGLGMLLLYDLLRRVPGLATWYSNDGLLPNHTSLARPGADYVFSLLFAASRTGEAAALFAVMAVVFVAFTIGWHTKLFHVLSFVCLVSLHSRAIFLENGGDVVLNLLCAWTLFFPMGARFSIDALCDRGPGPPTTKPVASLAMFAILLELAAIYYLNALHKTGWTWRQGQAVHYVMYQERMITWFGLLIRPYLAPWITLRLTYTTWNIEFLAPLILLNPIFPTWSRRLAVILLPALHIAFAAALNLGQFSFNMTGFYPLLLGARDWELLERWFGPRLAKSRLLVPVRSAIERLAPRVASRAPSPARLWFKKRLAAAREIVVVVVAIALGSQVLMENVGIPQRYKLGQTKWMQQIVQYPRLFQGWRMFSPDVPTGERMVYVDALTADGRHVDPYNEAASRVATLPVERIPLHMEQDEFWCDFTNRVPDSDTYWRALKAWIFDYPRRTGRPEDRIVSFEAKTFEQDNAPPGESEPKNFRTKVMFRGYEQEDNVRR